MVISNEGQATIDVDISLSGGGVTISPAPALWEELGPRSAILIADLMIATGSLHGAISIATGKSLARCIRNLSEGAIADFTDKQNYSESVL